MLNLVDILGFRIYLLPDINKFPQSLLFRRRITSSIPWPPPSRPSTWSHSLTRLWSLLSPCTSVGPNSSPCWSTPCRQGCRSWAWPWRGQWRMSPGWLTRPAVPWRGMASCSKQSALGWRILTRTGTEWLVGELESEHIYVYLYPYEVKFDIVK